MLSLTQWMNSKTMSFDDHFEQIDESISPNLHNRQTKCYDVSLEAKIHEITIYLPNIYRIVCGFEFHLNSMNANRQYVGRFQWNIQNVRILTSLRFNECVRGGIPQGLFCIRHWRISQRVRTSISFVGMQWIFALQRHFVRDTNHILVSWWWCARAWILIYWLIELINQVLYCVWMVYNLM